MFVYVRFVIKIRNYSFFPFPYIMYEENAICEKFKIMGKCFGRNWGWEKGEVDETN